MYASRDQLPLNASQFVARMLRHFAAALGLLRLFQVLGGAGYAHFEGPSPLDGFVNSAMLPAGMGPVNPPQHPAGKVFAGVYALDAGLVFQVAAGRVLAPLLHRALHTFHWDPEDTPPLQPPRKKGSTP